MVFRQLRVAWLALLALAGSACESSAGSSIAVSMQLDGDSCVVGADQLVLNCNSTAIVQVRASDDSLITSDCVHLSSGALSKAAESMAGLLDLGSLPVDEALTIGLSMYSGTLEPCPLSLPASAAFMFGNTRRLVLDGQDSDIVLPLQCVVDDGGGPGGTGEAACSECDIQLQQCIAFSNLNSCDSIAFDCQNECFSAPDTPDCPLACDLLRSFCTDDPAEQRVFLSCSSRQNCVDTCVGSNGDGIRCDLVCIEAEQKCLTYDSRLNQCLTQEANCSNECGGSTSCLRFRF